MTFQMVEPVRQIRLEKRFRAEGGRLRIVRMFVQVSARGCHCVAIVAMFDQALQISLGVPAEVNRTADRDHCCDECKAIEEHPALHGLTAAERHAEFGDEAHEPAARAAPRRNAFVGQSLAVDLVVGRLALVDTEDIEERMRCGDEGGLVEILRHVLSRLTHCSRGRRGGCGRTRLCFALQAHGIREVVAAERERRTIFERHGGFTHAFAVDERAIRATEILDERHARLHENMRVPS